MQTGRGTYRTASHLTAGRSRRLHATGANCSCLALSCRRQAADRRRWGLWGQSKCLGAHMPTNPKINLPNYCNPNHGLPAMAWALLRSRALPSLRTPMPSYLQVFDQEAMHTCSRDSISRNSNRPLQATSVTRHMAISQLHLVLSPMICHTLLKALAADPPPHSFSEGGRCTHLAATRRLLVDAPQLSRWKLTRRLRLPRRASAGVYNPIFSTVHHLILY